MSHLPYNPPMPPRWGPEVTLQSTWITGGSSVEAHGVLRFHGNQHRAHASVAGRLQPWEMPLSISAGFFTSLPGSGIAPCGIYWTVVAVRSGGAGGNPSARYCRGSWGHTAHSACLAPCGLWLQVAQENVQLLAQGDATDAFLARE